MTAPLPVWETEPASLRKMTGARPPAPRGRPSSNECGLQPGALTRPLLPRSALVSVAVVNMRMTLYDITGLTKAHPNSSESSRKGYVGSNHQMVNTEDSQGQALRFPAARALQRAVVSRCMTRHTQSVETLLILPCPLRPSRVFSPNIPSLPWGLREPPGPQPPFSLTRARAESL